MAAPKVDKIYTAIVLDFETGGLDSKSHGVTQVAMSAVRLDTFEVFANYDSYIIPYDKVDTGAKKKAVKRKKKVEAELALEFESNLMDYDWKMSTEKIGISENMCKTLGKPLAEVVDDIIEFAKKARLSTAKDAVPIIVGQNILFDIGFLAQMFAFTGQKMKGVFHGNEGFMGFIPSTMDTINLGRMLLAHDKLVSSYNLETFAEALGIDLFDAHDAAADVEATCDIYRAFAGKMRSGDSGNLSGTKKVKTREHFRFL